MGVMIARSIAFDKMLIACSENREIRIERLMGESRFAQLGQGRFIATENAAESSGSPRGCHDLA